MICQQVEPDDIGDYITAATIDHVGDCDDTADTYQVNEEVAILSFYFLSK